MTEKTKPIKKYKFITEFSFTEKDINKEKRIGESMTIPGEAYTIAELYEKHKAGIMPDSLEKQATYQENPTFNIEEKSIDLVDVEEKMDKQITLEQEIAREEMEKKETEEVKDKEKKEKEEKTEKDNEKQEKIINQEDKEKKDRQLIED